MFADEPAIIRETSSRRFPQNPHTASLFSALFTSTLTFPRRYHTRFRRRVPSCERTTRFDTVAAQSPPEAARVQFIDPNLPKDLFGWHSSRLGLDMPIVRYGTRGHALLLFPTAQADFLENERFFLIKSIERFIFEGRVQVFSIDSINKHAWMNRHVGVREAARRQALYSSYVEDEVVPHIRRCLGDPSARIGVTGASFGAFYSATAFFRRPDLFDTLIAMSGFFDLGPDYLEGYGDENTYFHNPMSFLPNLRDPGVLDTLRHRSQIHIISGQGAYEAPHASRRLSELLWAKDIPHNLDLWGFDVNHDWPWWRRMLPHYVGERVGW
jgi:esterase/lipase superfamily enzyme